MHETSIAKEILDAVLQKTREAGAKRVLHVRGWVAETESLSRESIGFHFDAHARGTAAEGAQIALDLKHLSARCTACGHEYPPEHHLLLCPECGSTEADILGTPGLGIDSIDVE